MTNVSKEHLVVCAIAKQIHQTSFTHLVDCYNDYIEASHYILAARFDDDLCDNSKKPLVLMNTEDVLCSLNNL